MLPADQYTGPLHRFPEIISTNMQLARLTASDDRTPVARPAGIPLQIEGIYGSSAHLYYAAGWQPIPLVPKRKIPPRAARGFTGREGRLVDWDLMTREWVVDYAHFNIAVRAISWVGLDVDAYDGRRGHQTLTALQSILGPLPATWTSTARGPRQPSRIHFYRIPTDLDVAGAEARLAALAGVSGTEANLEVIHRGHRYAVVAPSIHPSTRNRYSWYRPDGALSKAPRRTDLARLPEAWQDAMAATERAEQVREPSTATGDADFYDSAPAGRALPDSWAGRQLLSHLDAIRAARAGSINETLNRYGFMLGQIAAAGFFTGHEALEAALEAVDDGGVHSDAWNRRNGKSWTARGVLLSAINAGLECPRFTRQGA